jgi:hypothetical protein
MAHNEQVARGKVVKIIAGKLQLKPIYREEKGCKLLFYEKTPLSGDKDVA